MKQKRSLHTAHTHIVQCIEIRHKMFLKEIQPTNTSALRQRHQDENPKKKTVEKPEILGK